MAKLWAQMYDDRRFGARWAAEKFLAKPGIPAGISQQYGEEVFWTGIEPAVFRSLTIGRGLSPDMFEDWIGRFYIRMILD